MDLKSFREDKLKITQSAFAELIGVEQSSISRWEKNPNSITLPVVQKILEKTGVSYEELTGWKKPIPKHLDVNNTWEKANFTKCTLSDYISTALGDKNLPDEYKKAYVEDLNNVITANLVKPKVAIVGRSDTGKSTLINALLGTDKMPTSWTPTTSIAVYIKHVADKPAFIEEDAWVFANQVGAECLWDERKLNDESYCRSWKIAAGGVEILHSFGTRQGENYNKEAGSAVVFIDAPVLKTCDIVDLPGFGTETESDDDITFATAQKADVVLYLSQANGFMRIEDITYLKRNISELPTWEKKGENSLKPLSNLFVIASQAHTVNSGNRVQLEKILDVGCANLIKTLPNEYWANRKKLSGYDYADNGFKELRSRFFAYTIDIPDICSPFNNALTEILESLPAIKNERTKAFVKSYVELRKPNLINELHKYEGIVRERDKYVTLLSEIEKNELSRTQDNDKRKKGVRDEIARLSSESIDEFSEYMAATINTDALVRLMKDRGIKNTKGDIEVFWSYLQSMIQERCETILAEKSEILSEKTKEYITSYAKNISYPFENNSIDVDFDAGWAFASAILTGVARFLFGSIGIVIGLLIAGGLGLVFGGGWEKSVAEKIVAHFDENDFSEKFRDRIRQYWQQTEEAFDKAAAELENEWDTYVRNLRDTVNGYDIQEIQHRIASLNYLSDFFKNIPL
ncbi:dynamin family protein [Phascolarctobacterium succinatutens]|uniref:dynamin family protein n=1 Tax=Phascolarctobacterium succinatutens TaxID=626940 RepID=UPI0023F67BE0|nr:dynamin family protein [Phascolarctobacterium succinatutens]